MSLSLSKGKWHPQNLIAPKWQGQDLNPCFSNPQASSQTSSHWGPKEKLHACPHTWPCPCLSSLQEKVLPLPKGHNVFLIISECHEKTQEEAVARPRCCLWPTEDWEIIPAGARGSASSVPSGMRLKGGAILCPSVGHKGSHQQCWGYVYVAAGVGGNPKETSVWLCPVNQNLPPKCKEEWAGRARGMQRTDIFENLTVFRAPCQTLAHISHLSFIGPCQVRLFFPFFRWRNEGSEKWWNLYKSHEWDMTCCFPSTSTFFRSKDLAIFGLFSIYHFPEEIHCRIHLSTPPSTQPYPRDNIWAWGTHPFRATSNLCT